MERVYEYEKNAYRYKVLMVNYIMVAILGYFLYRIFFVGTNTILWALGSAVCVYALANTYLRKSNPRIIRVSDEEIVFESFGEKRFEINKLIKFRLKVSTPNYQVLIRLEDTDRRHCTFWVTYSQFSDKLDLIAEFNYLERKIHPDSLRFRGKADMGKTRPAIKTAEPADETVPADPGESKD